MLVSGRVFPIEDEDTIAILVYQGGPLLGTKKYHGFPAGTFESMIFPTSRERWDMDRFPWNYPFSTAL